MHVLLAVLGLLGAAGCWWCRVKYMGQAASHAVDVAGRARGFVRRWRFRKKAESSPVAAVEDPRTAAVVLMVGIASANGPMSAAAEAEIRRAMREVMAVEKPDEELIFARWAVSAIADLNNLVFRFGRLWTARLDHRERRDLLDCVKRVASADGEPDDIQLSTLQKLRDRLALNAESASA